MNDARVFGAIWNFLVIATWGADGDGDFAVDVVVDQYSQATSGRVILTVSLFCDVAVRWPALFSYTDAGVVSPLFAL